MIAVFAGSFDPPTKGHINLIQRALRISSNIHLHVIVGDNPSKKTLFTAEERLEMLRGEFDFITGDFTVNEVSRIKPVIFDGLIVNYAKVHLASLMIRGVRTANDFEYENQLAAINKQICPGIDTILLPTESSLSTVSSSAVKELARFGAPIDKMVSVRVAKKVYEKLGVNA